MKKYTNSVERKVLYKAFPREIIDFDTSRNILEDDVINRYYGFIEYLPEKPKSVKKIKVLYYDL